MNKNVLSMLLNKTFPSLFTRSSLEEHGAVGCWNDPSFQPELHNWYWCMRYPVYRLMHIKEPLLLIRKSRPCSAADFLSSYPSGPLLYVRHQVTIYKMCCAHHKIKKILPSIHLGHIMITH